MMREGGGGVQSPRNQRIIDLAMKTTMIKYFQSLIIIIKILIAFFITYM